MQHFSQFVSKGEGEMNETQRVKQVLRCRRGNSHVSELRLPPHQDVSDPFDLHQLSLDVVHSDGGVGHGDHLLL